MSFTTVGLIWGYGFVSWWNLVFNPEVRFAASVSRDIYLDSQDLNTTVLVYQSNVNLETASITSLCDITSSFITQSKWLYFFSVDYTNDPSCDNGNIVLSIWEDTYANTIYSLNLINDVDMYSIYIDFSSDKLREYQKEIDSEIKQYSIYKDYDGSQIIKYYQLFVGQKKYENAVYKNNIINSILSAREERYISPVAWREVPEHANRVPNAGRPYRENYTDGIHHWWDIYTDLNEEVIALDDAIVVRVVDWFQNSDFSRIVYGNDLSLEQELKNLDILRGNQVWIKTMKGEVVFYSHLSLIEGDLEEGEMVKKWDLLGKVWISWVPEEWYDDYHLHFAIMENPYNFLRAGTYDFWDYMAWDWLTRGEHYHEVIESQKTIFE